MVEAKKEGETLTGVAWQTGKYLDGLPDEIPTALEGALPFAYQSTGVETRFTNTPAARPTPRAARSACTCGASAAPQVLPNLPEDGMSN